MKNFIEKLKAHLASRSDRLMKEGDNPWANGDTESGFYPDPPEIDMDALNAEIDAFVESFKEQP